MHFLFLNQYAPPDPAPTARLLEDVANGLRGEGHTVEILSQNQDYRARSARGGSRLRREFAALWAIGRAGIFRPRSGKPAPRVDVILSLSSPPGLLVVAALLAIWHRVPLAHWAMDLYPELARELGEIGPGLPYRLIRRAMTWAYRRCALIVALDEDMQRHLQHAYRVDSMIVPPWPSPEVIEALDRVAAGQSSGVCPPSDRQEWAWLYSGNLGRAHEWETLLAIQTILETRGLPIHLIFQGDGAARNAAQARADVLGLKRCVWKGYVPAEELIPGMMTAGLLVVTQRPATRGLLWPSKLALVERLPRPVLWIGPVDGAIARRLECRGNAGIFAPGNAEDAARWVETRYRAIDKAVVVPAVNTSAAESCSVLVRSLLTLRR